MEKVLHAKNGIPIYYYPNEHLHSFCLCLYIKAGSMYEPDELNGSTHLWEHIIFRKLNRIYQGNLYKYLFKYGLVFSACTYKEFVQIKITGATKHFQKASQIIALVFEPINLSAKEVNLEKRRVKSEIREDSEKSSLGFFTQKITWENTSLANTITGKHKVIDKIGVRALEDVQKKILSLSNVFFYITGYFSNEDIVLLSEYIEVYKLMDNTIHNNVAPVPKSFFKRNGQIGVKNSYFHYVRFSFDIDTIRYTFAELDLLYDILFNGDNSKINTELSEDTGLIYSFEARFERYANLGNFYFYYEIEKKNIMLSIQKTIDVLRNMKTNITDELSYVLPFYVDNAFIDIDYPESLNWIMAYECHIMQNTYKSIEERKESYQQVTPLRIMEIANEVFTLNNMLITLKTNKKAFQLDEAYAITAQL